jgi:hypothetical protein
MSQANGWDMYRLFKYVHKHTSRICGKTHRAHHVEADFHLIVIEHEEQSDATYQF